MKTSIQIVLIVMIALLAIVLSTEINAATNSPTSLAGWDVVSDPNNPMERVMVKEFTQAASAPTAFSVTVPEYALGPYSWRIDAVDLWYNDSSATTEWIHTVDYTLKDMDGDSNPESLQATLANAVEDSQVRVRIYAWRSIQ